MWVSCLMKTFGNWSFCIFNAENSVLLIQTEARDAHADLETHSRQASPAADRFASKEVSFFFALLFFYPTFFDIYIYICILSVRDNCGIVAGSAAKVVPLEILR